VTHRPREKCTPGKSGVSFLLLLLLLLRHGGPRLGLAWLGSAWLGLLHWLAYCLVFLCI